MKNPPETYTEKKRHNGLAIVPNVFAYVASAAIGGTFAAHQIKEICHEKVKKDGLLGSETPTAGKETSFEGIVAERRKGRQAIWNDLEAKPTRRPGLLFRNIGLTYDRAKESEFEKRGFKTITDYAEMLSNKDRWQVAERVLPFTGIALGSLLVIANSKPVARLFSGGSKDETSQSR